jgi:AraC-like DNA-binding protein/quercetin dioxygenase-like cupin family protein
MMSLSGQDAITPPITPPATSPTTPQRSAGAIVVASYALSPERKFDWHVHDVPQLAWAADGVLSVQAPGGTWVLPPTRALWIPAGVPHTLAAHGAAITRSLYLRPEAPTADLQTPTVIAVRRLLRELIVYLSSPSLATDARIRAEAVVFDLLEPVSVTTVELAMPSDDRARRVAEAIIADAADARTLQVWGRTVGASDRTLSRAFRAETGMSFGRWRTQARMLAALGHLAEGVPVTVVAHRVGYAAPSAFVAAFRRAFGVPPGAYFT